MKAKDTPAKRVMLVEPNPIVRTLLTLFLRQKDYLLSIPTSYEDALKVIRSPFMGQFPPHSVICSVQLKQRTCLLFLAHLMHEAAYRQTSVIVIVNAEEQQQRDMAQLLNRIQAHVLVKPIQVQSVMSLVATSTTSMHIRNPM